MAIILSFAIYNITHVLLTFCPVEIRLAETIGRLLSSIAIIWVGVFYHALIDIASDLPVIFFDIPAATEGAADIPLNTAISNILADSVFLFIGLFLARKSKSKYA